MLAAQRGGHHAGDQALAAQNGLRTLAQRNIPVITRRQAALAIDFPVGNRHRQHRAVGSQRRLQQGSMKMEQSTPVGCRSFRKNGNVLALPQQFGNLRIDDPGVPTTASAQENRIVLGRKPADDWPVTNLHLRHEGRRQGRIDDENIDPRNVVGNQQGAGYSVGQIGFEFDTQCVKQGGGPCLLEQQAPPITTNAEHGQRDDGPAENQQSQSQVTVGTNEGSGLLQASCPR